jgi:serine protease Do
MSDFNQLPQNPFQFEEPVKVKKSGPSKFKSFASLVAAGMVGSALTLAVAPYMDFNSKEAVVETSNKTETINQVSTSTSKIVPTQTSALSENTSNSIADIIEKASKAVVGIVNKQTRQDFFSRSSGTVERGSGSGVVFRKVDGTAYIITNNHVVEGAEEIEVSFHNGEKTTAQLVGADALTDLAVIKVDAKYATNLLEIGDSSQLRLGDQVLAIGNPLGLDLSRTVTQGIVSAVNRSVAVDTSAGEWDLNVIQTDAAINPGNSGGALINTSGQLIGINSLKISESGIEGLGFAIPSNDVVPIVNEMIENGKIERPYMGVSLANIDEVPRSYLQTLPNSVVNGAIITYIDPNSAAKDAGLKVEDVIVSINDQEVKAAGDIRKYMYAHTKVGDKVTLKLYRDGKLMSVNITLKSNQTTD